MRMSGRSGRNDKARSLEGDWNERVGSFGLGGLLRKGGGEPPHSKRGDVK